MTTSKTSPTVSVAIATYNGEKYLREQLGSIGNQDTAPDEIVISDDNSSDGTLKVVDEFRQSSKIPVKLVVNDKATPGVVHNFLNAFAHCSSEYICYCDQDDYWMENKLTSLLEKLSSHPKVTLIIHKSRSVDENLVDLGIVQPNFQGTKVIAFPSYYDDSWGFGHQMAFHRSLLGVIRDISVRKIDLGEVSACFDFSIIVAAGMLGDILLLDQILVLFRRHSRSLTTAGKSKSRLSDNARRAGVFLNSIVDQLNVLDSKLGSMGDGGVKNLATVDDEQYLIFLKRRKAFYLQLLSLYQSKNLLQLARRFASLEFPIFKNKMKSLSKHLIYASLLKFSKNEQT